MTEYNRSKKDYLFAKAHGICVNCKNETAEPGKTLCFECAEKSRARNRKAAANRTEEQKETMRRKHAEYCRQKYAERKAAGICTKCGERKAVRGRTLCIDCRTKRRRKKDPRWNNDIPRSERVGYGLCYVCGKPVCRESKSLCLEHYELYSGLMRHRNANPTEKMIRAREEYAEKYREFKRIIYGRGGRNG